MPWEVAYIDKETDTPLAVHVHSNGSLGVRNVDTDAYYSLTATQMSNIYNTVRVLMESTLPGRIAGLGGLVLSGGKSDMPVAGQPGGEERFYIAADEGSWYRDNGSSWELMFGADAGQEEPSQRSLGTGSQKAAAGDHTHY